MRCGSFDRRSRRTLQTAFQSVIRIYWFFSKWLIWFLLPVTCNEFIVLNSPKSVEFKGTSDLPSESLSDVLAAPLGFSIGDSAKFDGLFVKDPFSSAQSVVTVVVEGVDSLDFKVSFSRKIYSVKLHNNLVISERQVIQSCRRRAQFRERVPHKSPGS